MIDKDLIRVFSVLSILNTYDKIFPKKYAYEDEIQKIKYKNFKNDNNNFKIIRQRNNSINSKYIPIKKGDINYVLLDTNKKYQFKLIDMDVNPKTGYEGYAYKNLDTNEIIIVHEGSQALGSSKEKYGKEIKKDWYDTNKDVFLNKLPSQYYNAKNFVDKIRNNYSKYKIYQVGQSLGGLLSQLTAILNENNNIETYTFNSYGAAHLLPELQKLYGEISNNSSNITNFNYGSEAVSRLYEHIGSVYMAKNIGVPHSVEIHANKALEYKQVYGKLNSVEQNFNNLILHYNNGLIKYSEITPVINGYNYTEKYCSPNYNVEQTQNANYNYAIIQNKPYRIYNGKIINKICETYNITEEELLRSLPWLNGRYDYEKKFLFLIPGEEKFMPTLHPELYGDMFYKIFHKDAFKHKNIYRLVKKDELEDILKDIFIDELFFSTKNSNNQFKFQLELEDNRLYSVSQARLDDFRDKIRFDFFRGIKQKREIY